VNTGVPVIEFVDAGGSPLTSHTCNIGHIRTQIFDADGSPRTGSVLLSASYPAFWTTLSQVFHVGRWEPARTAQLGEVVTLSGGGPVTAADAANATNTTTDSFPVWPPELCGLVTSVNKKVSQIVWANGAKLFASSPACAGDCGAAGPVVVFWADAEDLTRARNYVSVSGRSAEDIKAQYKVEQVSGDARSKLILENPFVVMQDQAEGLAEFVGPVISIERRKPMNAGPDGTAAARISFARPRMSGAYAIVRLRDVGGRQAWVEETPLPTAQPATRLQADVTSDGVYALVFSPAERPRLLLTPIETSGVSR
jgi:hypothetical protein